MGLAHQEGGRHRPHRIPNSPDPVSPVLKAERNRAQYFGRRLQPERGGVHLHGRHVEFTGTDVLVREELDFLEADDLFDDVNLAVGRWRGRLRRRAEGVEDTHLRVGDRVRVVVAFDGTDLGAALPVIQLLDVVGVALEHVDRLFVEGRVRAHEVHFRDDPSTLAVVHHEVVRADGAQAHTVGRIGIGGPEPPVAGPVEDPFFLEHSE